MFDCFVWYGEDFIVVFVISDIWYIEFLCIVILIFLDFYSGNEGWLGYEVEGFFCYVVGRRGEWKKYWK